MLQSIALQLLYRAVAILLGSQNWATVLTTVWDLERDTMLTGAQKRAKVVAYLESTVFGVGRAMLNLAVEAAVQWVRAKGPKE
ncbi:hypothetical protein [uncultured Thiodictyon sp.]|uniref:hypothetical protein n=1 Tax=uncultured Thiodictyon sp. TaxID=1846217 RepID=UPI0025FA392B|nr:hypothetical protein [uncultured Thiodictyon sp.]